MALAHCDVMPPKRQDALYANYTHLVRKTNTLALRMNDFSMMRVFLKNKRTLGKMCDVLKNRRIWEKYKHIKTLGDT